MQLTLELPVYPKPNPQSEDTIALNTSEFFYSNDLKNSLSLQAKDSSMDSFFFIHFIKWFKDVVASLAATSNSPSAPKLSHITLVLPTKVEIDISPERNIKNREDGIVLEVNNMIVFKQVVECIYHVSHTSSFLNQNILFIIRDCFASNHLHCTPHHLQTLLTAILFLYPVSPTIFFPLEDSKNMRNYINPSSLSSFARSKQEANSLSTDFSQMKEGYLFSPSLFTNKSTHVNITTQEEWADSMSQLLHSVTNNVKSTSILCIGCGWWNIGAVETLARKTSFNITCVSSQNSTEYEDQVTKRYPNIKVETNRLDQIMDKFEFIIIMDSSSICYSNLSDYLHKCKSLLSKGGKVLCYGVTVGSFSTSARRVSHVPIQFSLLEKLKYSYNHLLDSLQAKYFGSITAYATNSISTENFPEVCKVVADDCFKLFPPLSISSTKPLLSLEHWNSASSECGLTITVLDCIQVTRLVKQMESCSTGVLQNSSSIHQRVLCFNFALASAHVKLGDVKVSQIILSVQ